MLGIENLGSDKLGLDRKTRRKLDRRRRAVLKRARRLGRDAGAGARSAAQRTAHAAREAKERATAGARSAWKRRPGPGGTALVAAGAALGGYLALRSWSRRPTSWRGRVALVTGGSRGLGFALARELAAEGCTLVICARDETGLERASHALRTEGAEVYWARCDVTNEREVDEMVAAVVERFGGIDVLVNNVGDMEVGPIEHLTTADFRRAHDAIVGGAVHTTLAALPDMLEERSGHILNVSSLGGRTALPHLVAHDSAQFALTGFSEGLRAELAPSGISVTTLAPGTMRTGRRRSAPFQGHSEQEYSWCARAATLPGVAVDPQRVARAAVRAMKRGQAEVVLPLYARVLTRLRALCPGTAATAAEWVGRRLPDAAEGGGDAVLGSELEARTSGVPGSARNGRNVGVAERTASCVAGSALVAGSLLAARRGGALGVATGLVGAALLARGATGHCPAWRSLGLDTPHGSGSEDPRPAPAPGPRSERAGRRPREAYGVPPLE